MEVWQLTERFVAQHVAKALQGEQIICLEISWRTMPAILMTQSRRLLTNQGDVTTSCLRKSLGGGGRGLWQVDKIKGLGTSPLSFLLVFPLGIISRNVLVPLFQQWLVFFGLNSLFSRWTKHSLKAHPSSGVCFCIQQLWATAFHLKARSVSRSR